MVYMMLCSLFITKEAHGVMFYFFLGMGIKSAPSIQTKPFGDVNAQLDFKG